MADSRSTRRALPRGGLIVVLGIIASAIAVMGTLLGVAVAHRYQERIAARSAARADRERGHQRFLDACADFIALAEDYRRAQYDRWTSQHSVPDSDVALAARTESYRLYVEVRSSVFRLRLVAVDPQAQHLAEHAAEIQVRTREIFFATDRADMLGRGEVAELACEAFADRAREVLAAGEQ
ncbi:hypothetical protein [Streptomyces sp. NBC_00826]|uniref:hypothetical protein n=1 Tax=Streptomyces sp. NBC_00826 TaxID=2975845 RepID=UPI00386C1296|nr:hypothetical protein OG832_44695 [Streptomyces sp. NBC_00826]WTB60606.1 hypothetical protein OG832_47210 [Streptomyces sp. NBC_00826]